MTTRKARKAANSRSSDAAGREPREDKLETFVPVQTAAGRAQLSLSSTAIRSYFEQLFLKAGVPSAVAMIASERAWNEFRIRGQGSLGHAVDAIISEAYAAALDALARNPDDFARAEWTVRAGGSISELQLGRLTQPGPRDSLSGHPEVTQMLRSFRVQHLKSDLPMKTGRPAEDDRDLSYFHQHEKLKRQKRMKGSRVPAEEAREALALDFGKLGDDGERARLRRGRKSCRRRGCHPELHPSKR